MTTESRPAQNPDGTFVDNAYAQDFTGMATEPFSDEARKVLAECPRHEDVEVKPDGICYMPGVWYRRQLTRAFGAGAWALRPTGPARTVGNTIEWPGALYVLGRWVAEAVGGQATSDWMSHADSIQGAKTDCLSKCCGHGLAMASELWDKTWREAWMNEYTTKEWKDGQNGKKGKWIYSLKQKREPRAADLMGSSAQGAQGPATNFANDAASGQTGSSSAGADAAGVSDTGEAATQEAYEAVATQFKRLKFKKDGCLQFLRGSFGVDKITALTAAQADAARLLLLAYGTEKYASLLSALQDDGAVLRP